MNKENIKIMTVKIQRSLFGSPASALIYNRDRSFCCELPFDTTFRTVMGESVKGYFKATVTGDKLEIIKRVHDLDW